MTVRPLVEADRDAVFRIARICFNVPPEWIRSVGPELRLDRYLGSEVNGALAGVAADFDLRQWFHGRAVRCSGVASVAVLPEHRGAGHASRLVEELLRRARREGMAVSSLYPATTRVYRQLGYELAGQRSQFRVKLSDLPAGWSADGGLAAGGTEVAESGLAELDVIRRCYRRFASRHTGLVECDTEDWWRRRVFRLWSDAPVRVVVARRPGPGGVAPAGEIEGYAAFQLDAIPGTWSYDIACTHFIALTPGAAWALLKYFRGYRGLGQSLSWYGSPNEPLAVWLGAGAEDVTPVRTQRFMTRLVDVSGALTARGWPEVSVETTFAVRDALFPENEGPWRMEVSEGRARVERADRPAGCLLSIGALSALYTGHLTMPDLVSLGWIDPGEPQLPALSRIFSGPAPWMPDIF